MSPGHRPTVRCLLACEKIEPDPLHPKQVNLVRLITHLRPKAGQNYPVVASEFRVFAMLTECRGSIRLRVEVRNEDRSVIFFRTSTWEHRFPNAPLMVNGFRARLVNLTFPTPGLYWVQLWSEETLLSETPITLRP